MSTIMALKARFRLRLDRYVLHLLNNSFTQQTIKNNSSFLNYCTRTFNDASVNCEKRDSSVSKPNKKKNEVKMTVPDDSIMVTDFISAKKIAKSYKPMLVKDNTKQMDKDSSIYELISDMESVGGLQRKKDHEKPEVKSDKTIKISSVINLHDFNIKLKRIKELLNKKRKVTIIVATGSPIQIKIFNNIESIMAKYEKTTKVAKRNSTVFTIIPILKEKDNDELIQDEHEMGKPVNLGSE